MIRQLIREMLFNESARKMSDLPPGVYVGIKEGSGYVQVYFCDKDGLDINNPQGLVKASFNNESGVAKCNDAMIMSWAKVKDGYGPLLYDILMEFATDLGRGLTPDRYTVSRAAKKVWSYYFNNRSDITRKILDYEEEPFITPDDKSDDCNASSVRRDWEEYDNGNYTTWEDYYKKSPLNYVYFSKGTPTIDELIRTGKLYELD